MKKRLIIWGTGKSARKCREIFDDTKCEIVAYVESVVNKKSYCDCPVLSFEELSTTSFEYLIVASVYDKEIEKKISEANIYGDKTLFWVRTKDKIKIIELFAKPVSTLPVTYQYYATKHNMSYQVCDVDGCHYIFSTKDDCISKLMIDTQETFAKREMEFVFENVGREKGIFLDIGANIGTTSIYVNKCVNPEIKVIAFEPLKENYDLLRMNTILNQCENIKVEQYGLSNISGIQYMQDGGENCGGSHIVENEEQAKESITCVTLDEYVEINAIPPQDIQYVWIDVEGHEPYVIEGAKKTLEASKAYLFMEYNSSIYKASETYQNVLKNLKKIYRFFCCAEQSYEKESHWRKIEELDRLAEEMQDEQCNILLKK